MVVILYLFYIRGVIYTEDQFDLDLAARPQGNLLQQGSGSHFLSIKETVIIGLQLLKNHYQNIKNIIAGGIIWCLYLKKNTRKRSLRDSTNLSITNSLK